MKNNMIISIMKRIATSSVVLLSLIVLSSIIFLVSFISASASSVDTNNATSIATGTPINNNKIVTLNGGSSNDPDGTITSYLWEQIAGPTVTLNDNHAVNPTFIAPYTPSDTTLTFKLIVTDDDGATNFSNVNVMLKNVEGTNNTQLDNATTTLPSDTTTTPSPLLPPQDQNQSLVDNATTTLPSDTTTTPSPLLPPQDQNQSLVDNAT